MIKEKTKNVKALLKKLALQNNEALTKDEQRSVSTVNTKDEGERNITLKCLDKLSINTRSSLGLIFLNYTSSLRKI